MNRKNIRISTNFIAIIKICYVNLKRRCGVWFLPAYNMLFGMVSYFVEVLYLRRLREATVMKTGNKRIDGVFGILTGFFLQCGD